ncbi:hypothetical protein [Paraburkholderia dilworthii]|uniref:hypothetical protein n=1 Tax=Paraburkholderia dilworthii TaxID=948106 RepID=UPI001FCBD681|nr:hypothetical protein [Paraburkholderia dilworthii]
MDTAAAPSVTRVVGVSADVSGHPVVTELVAYKPDSQALRTSMRDMAVRWFTIEPVLTDSPQTSRMSSNINSVKAQMIGAATDQFKSWLRDDAPFPADHRKSQADPRSERAQYRCLKIRLFSLSSQRRPRRPARPAKSWNRGINQSKNLAAPPRETRR